MAERQSHTHLGIKGTAWLLGACLSLLPILTHALGLGRIKVHSTLNEPLNAEIEFTSITDKELKGLNAALASRAEFDAAGIERMPYLATVKFVVAKRLDGRHILQLTTEQPIEEPFLHLLVQVEWTGGRLVREYSALIDPPAHLFAKPRDIEPPRVPELVPAPEPAPVAAEPVTPAPVAEPEPRKEPAAVAKIDAPAPAEETPKTEPLVEPLAPAAETAPAEVARQDDLLGPAVTPKAGMPVVEEIPPGPITPHAVQEPEPAAAKETAAEAPALAAPSAAPGDWSSVSEYTVRSGDTLWNIAGRLRADQQLAMEQVILAIYRNNPDAFFGKNVNNLRAGKILKMPEREAVTDMSADLARREFRAQYNVWQEYKLKLAAGSRALTVPEPTEAPKVEAAPAKAPEAAKPERPPTAQASKQPDELLKIVRANLQGEKGTPDKKVAETESAKDAKERQALAERVTTLEESLVSRQLEAKELSDRIGAVRAQLKRESRLIEIESQQLAQAQQKEQAPAAAAKPAPKPEAKPAEAPRAVEAPKAEAPSEAPAPVAQAPAAKPKPVVAPPPPPAEETGFVDELLKSLLENELLPALIGIVVLASGALGFLYYRRRRRAIGEFEESILSSEAISSEGAAATTTDTAGQVASAGDTSFLSDFSQGGMGNIHTDEVDPIAEAEVYLAYGRDETAEEILKDAVVKNPDRQELKLKLLEIYHQRSDVKAFETLAEELYAALGGRRDKIWEKVEDMGRKLNPGNPMFRGGAPGRKAEAAVAPSAFGATQPGFAAAGEPAKTAATGSVDFSPGGAASAPEPKTRPQAVDFDLDLGATQAVDASPVQAQGKAQEADAFGLGGFDERAQSLDVGQAESQGIDFDLGALAEPEAPAQPQSVDFTPSPKGERAIDFDMDLGVSTPREAGAPAPEGGEPSSAQWDETATKLDLAKAYIDMGDAEGARSILDEVLAEGSDDQKRQAKELAAQLS